MLSLIAVFIVLASPTHHFLRQAYWQLLDIPDRAEKKINRHDMMFDPTQPQTLLARSRPDDLVLYYGEKALYYFLLNGTLSRKAIFPTVGKTLQETGYGWNDPHLRFMVSEHVVANGRVRIYPKHPVVITLSQPIANQTLWLQLDNSKGGAQTLQLEGRTQKEERVGLARRLPIASGWSGWLSVNLSDTLPLSHLTLKLPDKHSRVKLSGIRLDPNSPLNWSWNRGVQLQTVSIKKGIVHNRTIDFNSQALIPTSDRQVNLLADKGGTILAELL
ncbi:MAG: hypothetical protein HQL72_14240 [Magnetococcales bacterium]|nr:hypothetical protein [Magnetococcales bacterium]